MHGWTATGAWTNARVHDAWMDAWTASCQGQAELRGPCGISEVARGSSDPQGRSGAGPRCSHLLMRSSLLSLSISSSMAACRSPMRLKASFRSDCRLWLAASRLSRSISCREGVQ